MSIKREVEAIIGLVEEPIRSDDIIHSLIKSLDRLVCLVHEARFDFDENEYQDAPESNYAEIRGVIEKKFREFTYYQTSDFQEPFEKLSEVAIGDAVDDIVDIIADLKEVKWYFENTSRDNAVWHFVTGFRDHWGNHLRQLQMYLYRNHY